MTEVTEELTRLNLDYELGTIRAISKDFNKVFNYEYKRVGLNEKKWVFSSTHNSKEDFDFAKKNKSYLAFDNSTTTNANIRMGASLLKQRGQEQPTAGEPTAGAETNDTTQVGIYETKTNKFGRITDGTKARILTTDEKYILAYEYNSLQGAWLLSKTDNQAAAKEVAAKTRGYEVRIFTSAAKREHEMTLTNDSAIDLTK